MVKMEVQVITLNNIKVYVLKNFVIPSEKTNIQNIILERFNLFKLQNYEFGNNFLLPDTEFFSSLYYKFVYYSLRLFKSINLDSDNSTSVWAYVNNKDNYSTSIHNHKKTSIINGVYYLNVPDSDSGRLVFYDDESNEIGFIQPETNDLMIFDCNVNHKPLQSISDAYRIALNMEIKCNKEVLKYFRS